MLSIAYLTNKEVSLGNTLRPEDAQEQPILQITPESEDNSKTYTIILTDPDAPSRKDTKWSEFCHWIITDVKLPSLEAITASATAESMSIDLSRSRELVKYMGPAPPEKTGKHRYVFLLYRNPSSGGSLEGPSERKKWGNDEPRKGAREWADKYGLELVGMYPTSLKILIGIVTNTDDRSKFFLCPELEAIDKTGLICTCIITTSKKAAVNLRHWICLHDSLIRYQTPQSVPVFPPHQSFI